MTAASIPDPFFHLPAGSEWNACIGSQGHEEHYVDGYIEAAIELTGAILAKRLYGQRDTLVLPILYSARHGVELTIKFSLSRLRKAGVVTRMRKIDHDIAADYALIRATRMGDAQLTSEFAALAPYVQSLETIDRDGQMLRYARARTGAKSMGDKSLANIEVIHASLIKLKAILDAIKYRVVALVDERRTGSFTPDCSRRDLMEIAKMLPPRDKWRDAAFDEAKAAIKTRFAIGSNKFATALNVIQAHREMGGMLGLAFPLAHLSDAQALYVVSQWRRRHPDRQEAPLGMDYFDRDEGDWKAMKEDALIAKEVNEAVLAALSADEIADLDTIFYLGRDRVPCEDYDALLETTRKRQRGDIANSLNHLMEKTNFAQALEAGLKALGQRHLAARVAQVAGADVAMSNPS